ncbi:nitroreductase family protein [Paenibacillus sp. 481]|uniref:nitroreductase family protein n=1 Tax=Paenibacillus sp. 481 TaxID=2835869 RepID=UPI001E43E439|nr:hypothetical protein [Paenibacillus sp. 481]UHA74285.1 nitroreductase family protein [Paenibacillus sp. 481]
MNNRSNQSGYWDHAMYKILDNDILNEVVKFHQSCTTILHGYDVTPFNSDTYEWLSQVELTDIIPNYYESEILLPEVKKVNHVGSKREFELDYNIAPELLSEIMYLAFGRSEHGTSKRYPSGGGLYPVIPVLYLLEDNIILHTAHKKGTYIYDYEKNSLKQIKAWDDREAQKVLNFLNAGDIRKYSNYMIGYAIDIRRSVAKYKRRGYRHSLIEIGLMAQAFRETIVEVNHLQLGDFCWSGFDDHAFTYLSGLNPRTCPVTLVQWFGKVSN